MESEDSMNVSTIDQDDPLDVLLKTSNVDVSNSQEADIDDATNPKSEENLTSLTQRETIEDNINTTDNVLLSLIDEVNPPKKDLFDVEDELHFKKEELSTQIFSELPIISSRIEKKDINDSEFLMSLLD